MESKDKSNTIGNRFVSDEEIEGAIFDCDGTLVDSMRMWLPCWYHACEKFDLVITEERFWNLIGTPIHDIVIAIYLDKHNEKPSESFIESFLAEKRSFHEAHEADVGSPPSIECVVALVHEFKAKGIKVAIASSGLRIMVERHTKSAGILDLFDKVVVAAEVPNGKPAPDVYLKAAELLGVNPAKCRAYEDSEMGMLSAWRAGMQVIDVRTMEGYPMSEGLALAMAQQVKNRPWLDEDVSPSTVTSVTSE